MLWFAAALALVWAMRSNSGRTLVLAAAGLWAYTVVLEVAQRWVPTRTSQWIDVVGSGLGIVAGIAVGCASLAAWRFSRRGQALGSASGNELSTLDAPQWR